MFCISHLQKKIFFCKQIELVFYRISTNGSTYFRVPKQAYKQTEHKKAHTKKRTQWTKYRKLKRPGFGIFDHEIVLARFVVAVVQCHEFKLSKFVEDRPNLCIIRCETRMQTEKFVNLVHVQGAGRIKSIYLKQTQGSVKFVTSLFWLFDALVFIILYT